MVKFDGNCAGRLCDAPGLRPRRTMAICRVRQSEAIYVRPSNGHVVVNPINNFTHDFDGTSWSSIPGGPDQVQQYVEDSLGRLWGTGRYGGLGIYGSGGYTSVSPGDWFGSVKRDPDRSGTVWAGLGGEILRTDGTYRFSRGIGDFPEIASHWRRASPGWPLIATASRGWDQTGVATARDWRDSHRRQHRRVSDVAARSGLALPRRDCPPAAGHARWACVDVLRKRLSVDRPRAAAWDGTNVTTFPCRPTASGALAGYRTPGSWTWRSRSSPTDTSCG